MDKGTISQARHPPPASGNLWKIAHASLTPPIAHPAYARASQVTGAPMSQLESRLVRIFTKSQGVQSGTQDTLAWRMQWEDTKTKRWTNPLMGWTSTSDPLSNTHMTLEFDTKEAAISFAQKNGARRAAAAPRHPRAHAPRPTRAAWKYEVVEPDPPNRAIVTPKSYSDNFTWKGPKAATSPTSTPPPPPPPPPKE